MFGAVVVGRRHPSEGATVAFVIDGLPSYPLFDLRNLAGNRGFGLCLLERVACHWDLAAGDALIDDLIV